MIRTAYWLAFVAMATVISFSTWAIIQAVGPSIERALIPPVASLVFDDFACVDAGDVVATGHMDKTRYPNGSGAELLGFSTYAYIGEGVQGPRQRLVWRRPDTGDMNPQSRPPGEQIVRIRIIGGCGVRFMAYSEHRSPITGWRIPMDFGPFGG